MEIKDGKVTAGDPGGSVKKERAVHEMRRAFMPLGKISSQLKKLKPFGNGAQKYLSAVNAIERAEKDLVSSFNAMESEIDEMLKKELGI